MQKFLLLLCSIIMLGFGSLTSFATSYHGGSALNNIKWEGEKWEYLVEFPTNMRHIDPAKFEEITDTVGLHGWELVEVTSEDHFYVFYFKRPLLPHKIESHILRLQHVRFHHGKENAAVRERINQSMQAAKAQQMQEQKMAKPTAAPDKTPPQKPMAT